MFFTKGVGSTGRKLTWFESALHSPASPPATSCACRASFRRSARPRAPGHAAPRARASHFRGHVGSGDAGAAPADCRDRRRRRPRDRELYGYLSERLSFGESEDIAGAFCCARGAGRGNAAATTLGLEFDPDGTGGKQEEILACPTRSSTSGYLRPRREVGNKKRPLDDRRRRRCAGGVNLAAVGPTSPTTHTSIRPTRATPDQAQRPLRLKGLSEQPLCASCPTLVVGGPSVGHAPVGRPGRRARPWDGWRLYGRGRRCHGDLVGSPAGLRRRRLFRRGSSVPRTPSTGPGEGLPGVCLGFPALGMSYYRVPTTDFRPSIPTVEPVGSRRGRGQPSGVKSSA